LPAAPELLVLQSKMSVTPVASRIDQNDRSPELVVMSEPTGSAAQSGIAYLGAFYGGHRHVFRTWLRFGRAAVLRLEVHGHVSRMNKIVAHVARDGTIGFQGEEVENLVVSPKAGGFSVEMTFRAHSSMVEWIYLFGQEIDEGPDPIFSCAETSLQPLAGDGASMVCRHMPVRAVEGISVICQSFTALNNGFSLTFEILKPGSPLVGLGLTADLGLAYSRWWTWESAMLSPSDGELVACKPTHPIRSPGLMDEFGPDFANSGHAITGVFADWQELDRMGSAEADRLAQMTLHARFQCGTVVDLPLAAINGLSGMTTGDIVLFDSYLSDYAATVSETPTFLEVGARGGASASARRCVEPAWRYLGLDYMSDPNVDIVGDAHRLTDFLARGSVDVVYSSEVMEHLLSPLRFVLEANRVLTDNGLFIARMPTTWPLHAEPWDFWRLSSHGWTSILNTNTGFKILDRCEVGRASIVPQLALQGSGLLNMAAAPAPMLTMVVARKIRDVPQDTSGWSADLATGTYDHA
jgi:SAM-dependent methyltransferase